MVFAKQNKTPISNMALGLFSPETPPPPLRPSNLIEINKSLGGGGELNRGFRYLTKNFSKIKI